MKKNVANQFAIGYYIVRKSFKKAVMWRCSLKDLFWKISQISH